MPCGPVPKSEAEMKQKGEGSGTSYEKELPLPIMLFRSFVGTFGNLSVHVHVCKPSSMSFVPTKYLKYQKNIERNSSFRM